MNTLTPNEDNDVLLLKSGVFTDPRSKRLLSKYLVGGAALGGSAALATSLVNYLKMLKTRSDEENDTSKDDDYLYLNVGEKEASISGGTALTAGVLSSLGTYGLVRALYQKYKKQQVQKELDEAQNEFIGTVEDEAAVKKAAMQEGKPMGLTETLTSTPVVLTLLAALSSGVLAHKTLDKTFPAIKKKITPAPRKVIIRRKEDEDDDAALAEKQANHTPNGLELLAHLLLFNKQASQKSEIKTMVGAVTEGRLQELEDNVLEHGFDTAMMLCKGASESYPKDRAQEVLAISKLANSPALSPVFGMLVSAEFAANQPNMFKAANTLSGEDRRVLLKVANLFGAIGRSDALRSADLYIDKEAAEMPVSGLQNMLSRLKARSPNKSSVDAETPEVGLLDSDSDYSGDSAKTVVDVMRDASKNKTTPSDKIDKLLTND